MAAVGAGQQKSSELVLCALTRARFCELLAPQVQHGDSDLFFLGLLSLMDVILEMAMASVLEKVSVDHETKAVRLGSINHLRPLYQLMLAQESGAWEQSAGLVQQLHLSESGVAESYWQAMQWTRAVSSAWPTHYSATREALKNARQCAHRTTWSLGTAALVPFSSASISPAIM